MEIYTCIVTGLTADTVVTVSTVVTVCKMGAVVTATADLVLQSRPGQSPIVVKISHCLEVEPDMSNTLCEPEECLGILT